MKISPMTQLTRYAIAGATREIGISQTLLNQAIQREDQDAICHYAQTIAQAAAFILAESN